MKRIAVTVALPLLAALATMAQSPAGQKSGQASKQASPVVKCKGPDGTACTARQVQALSDAVFEAKRTHTKPLPHGRGSVTVASISQGAPENA